MLPFNRTSLDARTANSNALHFPDLFRIPPISFPSVVAMEKTRSRRENV